jgi:hypothetical protein
MLSLFPTFLSWNQIAPTLIRLVLGGVLIYWSILRYRKIGKTNKDWAYCIADAILGILLVIGLWTQLAAIIVGLDLIYRIVKKIMARAFLTQGVNYYLILLVLCFTLLVSGAGWFAFDLAL